jgi:hypothetical protein
MSKQLENASKKHSDDQARMRSMTHNGSDGSSPGDRVERAGYNWRSVAENVAYGYGDEEECMKEWMNSSGHRKNIMGSGYTHFGSAVAYAGSTPYYTQDFGGDGGSHNFPECPSGAAYGDAGDSEDTADSGYGEQEEEDYSDDSSPSSNYGGGSSPSSDYSGGSSPSQHGKSSPTKSYGGESSPSSDYGGGSSPSGGRRHRSGRRNTSYGGDDNDDNDDDNTSDYGNNSDNNQRGRHGKKPCKKPRHGGRNSDRASSRGRRGGRRGSY